MTFNYILMNPPYNGNLHLQIIIIALEQLSINGNCVDLSPIRWIQDPLAKYKRNSDFIKFNSLKASLKEIEVIKAIDAVSMFNAEMIMDLGIYLFDKDIHTFYETFNTNTIVDKVISKKYPSLSDKVDINKSDGWRVRLQSLRPTPTNRAKGTAVKNKQYETLHPVFSWVYKDGYTKDGRHWSTVKAKGAGGPKSYTITDNLPESIKFDSEEEAINFENSTKTLFHRYLVYSMKTDQHYPMGFIPFLGNVENPRTHKIGYKSNWISKDFFILYSISESEIVNIRNTMKQFNLGVEI